MKPVPRRRWRVWLVLALLFVLAMGGAATAAWLAIERLGRSPSEVLDYARLRLEGHPNLEAIALPMLLAAEQALRLPTIDERRQPPEIPRPGPNPVVSSRGAQPSPDGPGLVRVGPSRTFKRIGDAAREAPDGAVIEIDPGDYVADIAVFEQRSLTVRGLGDRVRVVAAGASAEGKALWVVRGGRVTIENIEFTGARVADGNGAGIRLESGTLAVRGCSFLGGETGILTANDAQAELDVENSQFGHTLRSARYTHALYVGTIARLRMAGNHFHHGDNGHLVKSRARVNRIEYNRLTDESGGRSSYEINLPNGGVADIVGNVIQQGMMTGNGIMISYGEEGLRWPENRLRVVHNTMINDLRWGGTFVHVVAGAVEVQVLNNLLIGPGRVIDDVPAQVAGNWRGGWEHLVRPAREDYRLNAVGQAALAGFALAPLPPDLQPKAEYRHPQARAPLAGPPAWPGALQSTQP